MTLWDTQRDRSLLRGAARGNETALWNLYDRHSRLLAARLGRRGASAPEIEEVLQETFLAAWRNASSYRGDGPVGGWLWGIAQRQYAQLIRREVGARTPYPIQPSTNDPEAGWVDHMSAQLLLDRLDPQLRSTVEAVAVQGMSVSEAAAHLGIPEGTVKSRMHRVRRLINEESI